MDQFYAQFVDTVAQNRGLSPDAVRATEAGLYYGTDAVKAGLADRVESQQAAIDRIAAEVSAKRSSSKPRSARAAAAAMAMAAQI
jgi:ClpP class serine protease